MPSRHTSTGRVLALGGVDAAAAYRAAQVGLATYAWLHTDLPASGAITSWVDARAGVVATGAGTTPQVATPSAFGGKRAVSFDGARWFSLGAAPELQTLNRAVVAVIDVPTAPASIQALIGAGSNKVGWYVGLNTNRRLIASYLRADLGTQTTNTASNFTTQTAVLLFRWGVSGSNVNVALQSNDNTLSADYATGHAGITATAWALGAFNTAGASPLVGSIADFVIFTGTDYAARAAAAFANARNYYGIS